MLEVLYILSIILVVGIISFYDWKKGIIKNRLLLILLILGILYYSYNFSFIKSNTSYFIWNILWSVFIGVFLWFIDIWPSGDAKLFIVLSLILPSSILINSKFPSLDLLVNLFVPLFIFFFFYSLIKSKKSDIKDALKLALDPHRIFTIFIALFGLLWFISEGLSLVGIKLNMFIFVIIIFLVLEIVNRFSSFSSEILYIILAIIRLIIDYKGIFTMGFAFQTLSIIFLYVFLRFFVIRMTFNINTKYVKISDLEPQMRVAEGIAKMKKGNRTLYEKIKLLHFDYVDILLQKKIKFIHSVSDEGLTIADIKKIQKIQKERKFKFDNILVHQDIPFALFISISFIVTILIKTNFIEFVKALL